MPNRRQARLNEQLKREISRVVRREVNDPRVGPITVTGVEVTTDLAHAKAYVRTLGDEAALAAALEGLKAAAPFIRRELGKALRLRRIPELDFREDRTLERAQRIEDILEDVRPDGGWGEDDPGDPDDDEGWP